MIDEVPDVDGLLVVLGEVHSALLQTSLPLPPARCEHALASSRGERVRLSQRPIAHAAAPDALTGVDCRLATPAGTRTRGIGTVASRATITGGHVLQGSATARLVRAAAPRRLPWSHYLGRPGCVEVVGRAGAAELAAGFLAPRWEVGTLDPGAVCTRTIDAVQQVPDVDRRPPLRAARTRLRWAAFVAPGEPVQLLRFGIEAGQLRTAELRCDPADLPAVVAFCEDLALHDWLLSTLVLVLARSRIGLDPPEAVATRLRPAVDHLLHLWMPAARADPRTAGAWQALDDRIGLSRQWRAGADRIRDQLTLGTLARLGMGTGADAGQG